jgi:hypothetical protein
MGTRSAIANRLRDVRHRMDTVRTATSYDNPLTRRRCDYGPEIHRLPRPPRRGEMHRGAFGRFRGGTHGCRDPARKNGAQVPDHSRVPGHDSKGDEGRKPARVISPQGRGKRAHWGASLHRYVYSAKCPPVISNPRKTDDAGPPGLQIPCKQLPFFVGN